MLNKKIVLESDYQDSFRNEKIRGMFDMEPCEKLKREWNVKLNLDEKWNIGVIVGSSGSGKTTIAKNLFTESYHKNFQWDERSIVDNFNPEMDILDITNILSHVGFSSPPNWLLPYHVLSNGQKFRVEVAKAILENENLIVFDEFTSVVDRTVAKIGSSAVAKTIRKFNKQFVAVSCHYDILEWLQPDWVFDVDKNEFSRRHLRRPEIRLEIHECDKSKRKECWQIFKHHHYLTGELSTRAKCFIGYIENNVAAFTSYITFPVCNGDKSYREHRTVVLPDFQGVGIGNKLSSFLGEYIYQNFKYPFFSTTSHPAMIHYRNKSKDWVMIRKPSILKKQKQGNHFGKTASYNRLTASFKYVGGSNSPCLPIMSK